MLHALRRSNLQHCIDLEETGSICCHYLRVFVTVSLFFNYLRAGWGTSLKRRRSFMPRKASENGYAGFWCVLLLWRSFALNRINKFFSLTIESNVTGADQDNRKDLPYCPRISCWYTTTLWRHSQSRTTRSTKIMISGTLHQNLRHRIWNSAMLTTTDFTTPWRACWVSYYLWRWNSNNHCEC